MQIKNLKLKTRPGFTLPDLMVSISIIVLLTLTAVMSFIRAEKGQNLINSAEVLASQIRAIENLSLAGKEVNGVVPLGGYGIQLAKPAGNDVTYIFFADMNRDLVYNINLPETPPPPLNLADVIITLKNSQPLKKNVFISHVIIDYGNNNVVTDPAVVNVLFKTPIAKVYVDGQSNIGSVSIVLEHREIGDTKTIKIYPISRQISVE